MGVAGTASARADAGPPVNAYDQLGRTLAPIAALFASAPEGERHAHTLAATLTLESMTGLAPEKTGGRLDLLLEPPGRALLRVSAGGEALTACRVGQEIWIAPAGKIAALLPPPDALNAPNAKKRKKAKALAPMALPFSPAQLALLPALFVVREAPPPEGASRALDVRLMPLLAEGLGVRAWSARLCYREGVLSALELERPGWRLVLRVEKLAFPAPPPAAAWQPGSGDVLRVSGGDARRWLEQAGEALLHGAQSTQPAR